MENKKLNTIEDIKSEYNRLKNYYDTFDYNERLFGEESFVDIEKRLNSKNIKETFDAKRKRAISIMYDIFFNDYEFYSKSHSVRYLSDIFGFFLLLMRKYGFIDINNITVCDKISKEYLKNLINQSNSDDGVKERFLYVLEELPSGDIGNNFNKRNILLSLLEESDLDVIFPFYFAFSSLFPNIVHIYAQSGFANKYNIFNKNTNNNDYIPQIYCYGNFSHQTYLFWLQYCLLNNYELHNFSFDCNNHIEETKVDNVYGDQIIRRKQGKGFNPKKIKFDYIYLHPDREDDFSTLVQQALLSLKKEGRIYLNVGLDHIYKFELYFSNTKDKYFNNVHQVKKMIVDNDILKIAINDEIFIIDKNKDKKGHVYIVNCDIIQNELIKHYNYNFNIDFYNIPNAVSLSDLLYDNVAIEETEGFYVKESWGIFTNLATDPFDFENFIYNAQYSLLNIPKYFPDINNSVKQHVFDIMTQKYKTLTSHVMLFHNTYPFNFSFCAATKEVPVIYTNINEENLFIFSFDKYKIRADYLALELTKPYIEQQFNVFANPETKTITKEDFLKIRISLPSLKEQEDIFTKAKMDEFEKQKQRLNLTDFASEISHSMAMPISRIQSIIGPFLEKKQEDGKIYDKLKKISDNINLINRIIESKGNFNQPLYRIKLKDFIEEYLEAWDNLPYKSFIIKPTIYDFDYKTEVMGDKNMLSILMDNILTNAHKHGFNKKVDEKNFVQIEIKQVQYKKLNFICLSIANNGRPFDDNFTLKDYVTKGLYGNKTGNTGVGGYDVYRIIKKNERLSCLK